MDRKACQHGKEERDFALLMHKAFYVSLRKMTKQGGQVKKRSEKAMDFVRTLSCGRWDELKKLPRTRNPERRIKSCVKINLGAGFRLITQRAKNCLVLLFIGKHDDCDKWLTNHRGLEFALDKASGTLLPFHKSTPGQSILLSPSTKRSETPILEKFSSSKTDELLENVQKETVMKLNQLDGTVTADEISETCKDISDNNRRYLVQDVLLQLAADDVGNAELRLDEFYQRTKTIDECEVEEILDIKDGNIIRRLVIGSEEYENWFKRFALEGDHLEWLLFMHPEQQKVVDADFDGPAQLSGVSGSGKTCIAVRRALRIANLDEKENILLVTLNRSLASLISKLVDAAAESAELRSRIKVTSFFELCQELLKELEPHRIRWYDAVAWKLNDHVDEVFREYYRCWLNFRAAEVLIPIHQSLCAQNINPETYLREEFDWIRSALPESARKHYVNTKRIKRLGRKHPIREGSRRAILDGLKGWEQKMEDVGVIDYLGLTTALSRHTNKLSNRFTRIVVDEAQDFGTSELSLLRQMVPAGANDIFLCGDIAQHILPKHRVLSQAGIRIGGRTCRIQRNYRNTRQILEAAHHVLCENLDEEMLDRPANDLEILDPKYANRVSAKPLVLGTESLSEEILYARSRVCSYLNKYPNANCCIALAGYSTCEVGKFAMKLGLRALDGSGHYLQEGLVLSDLEQTKGYEFDLVVIVNCCDGVLPRHDTPKVENYRDGCRLYVAMTRAKNELCLSYHGKASPWLRSANDKLTFGYWADRQAAIPQFITREPEKIPELENGYCDSIGSLNGEQYCYTSHALGLSSDAQKKLRKFVDGRGLDPNREREKRQTKGDPELDPISSPGTRVQWQTMGDLKKDLVSSPGVRKIFGPTTSSELIRHLAASLS